jgi:hypothetical protein
LVGAVGPHGKTEHLDLRPTLEAIIWWHRIGAPHHPTDEADASVAVTSSTSQSGMRHYDARRGK